jgi:hypothetical protein
MKPAASALPDADPSAAPRLSDAAKVVFWGLVFWGGAQLAAAVLERSATAMVAVQAGVAEWGAGRMSIAWTDPQGPPPSWRAVGRRAAVGAAMGFGCAAMVAVVALVARRAEILPGQPALASLFVGLAVASLGAVRDELLLRGVVVRATRLLPLAITLIVCGLAAAAARLGTDGRLSGALVPEALGGVALGGLWLRDRGAWMPVAANAAWKWTSGTLLGGSLLDVRHTSEAGAAGVVLSVAAIAAGAVALRGSRARGIA